MCSRTHFAVMRMPIRVTLCRVAQSVTRNGCSNFGEWRRRARSEELASLGCSSRHSGKLLAANLKKVSIGPLQIEKLDFLLLYFLTFSSCHKSLPLSPAKSRLGSSSTLPVLRVFSFTCESLVARRQERVAVFCP